MKPLWYIAACLVVPAVWGLVVARVYNKISEARANANPQAVEPVEMYHI
jgi:hypothetical protein